MTYSELIDEVTLLTGAPIQKYDLMLSSTNRALKDLYTRVSVEKTVRLAAHGLKPTAHYKKISCIAGVQTVIKMKGAAFSMRVHGSGQYRLENNDASEVVRINSPNETKLIRGFIDKEATLTLWSGLSFSVYNLSVYDRAFSSEVKDIPEYGQTMVYDLRSMYGDFMSFVSPPKDVDGNLLDVCELRDGKAIINTDYSGEIVLTYRRMPEELIDDDSQILDIPNEYLHLFPLLVTYYMLCTTDIVTASKCKDIFDECIQRMTVDNYTRIEHRYHDVVGWA